MGHRVVMRLIGALSLFALAACGTKPTPAYCSSPAYRPAYASHYSQAASCAVVKRCGELVFTDCGMAVDGTAYYVDTAAQCVLEVCGGACMGGPSDAGCRACPPPEWTCN
jgi:hypothetical protein